MKLAFCLFKYFLHGGLQSDFLAIAKKCQDKGHEVHVYTRSWRGEIPKGFQLHLFPCFLSFTNIAKDRNYIKQVTKCLKQADIDIVIGFNKMPGLDIYFAADTCYAEKISRKSRLQQCTRRSYQRLEWEKSLFTSHKTLLLVITEQQKKDFLVHYSAAKEKMFYLLPPGIDKKFKNNLVSLNKQNIKKMYSIPDNANIVLMVGSGFKTKGVDRSLLAMANLETTLRQKTHIIIAGKGKPKKYLALAKKLGILNNVHFIGATTDVIKLYQAATMLIHPSYTESAGKVLLEAMATGLPILTTENCGYSTYIKKSQSGLVVDMPFSQSSLNESLQIMLSSPEKLQKWKDNGRKFAIEQDLYSQHDQTVNIIENYKKDIHAISSR